MLALYLPVTGDVLDQELKSRFLAAVTDEQMFEVIGDTVMQEYDGQPAVKHRVRAQKDAVMAVGDLMAGLIDDEDLFNPTSQGLLDQAFGDSGYIEADVYVSQQSGLIIGVDLQVILDQPVVDPDFGSIIRESSAKAVIDWDGSVEVSAPEEYISEDEFDQLLNIDNGEVSI